MRSSYRLSTLVGAWFFAALVGAGAQAAVVYDGVINGRANKYDYAPAHLFVSGTHHLWWCSQSNSGDEIWYSKKTGALGVGGWNAPIKVFNTAQSPWSWKHVCDPSVIRGSFPYQGTTYSYAMYYTSLPSSTSLSDDIGVALSRTGINWNAYPTSIIKPSSNDPTQYGAGMSGVSYKPGTLIIQHVYFDSTLAPDPIRLTEGTGGIVFSPLPGNLTTIDDYGRFADGQGPDVAYYPTDQRWYAVIKTPDPNGVYDGETRILRAVNPDTLTGPWSVIGIINYT